MRWIIVALLAASAWINKLFCRLGFHNHEKWRVARWNQEQNTVELLTFCLICKQVKTHRILHSKLSDVTKWPVPVNEVRPTPAEMEKP